MKNLTTALFNKFTGSAFSTSVGGRLYKTRVPQNPTFPYAVYYVVSDAPQDTFTDHIEDVLIQFSVFSTASSSSEIEDILTNLKALYDNCLLSITGNTCVQMERTGGGGLTDVPADVEEGTGAYFQCDVDYEVIMQKN